MLSKIPQDFRKFERNRCKLHQILYDTQTALDEIASANIFPGEDIKKQMLSASVLKELDHVLTSLPALIVTGQTCKAKVQLVNALLGEPLLPFCSNLWRWILVRYGHSKRAYTTSLPESNNAERQELRSGWLSVPENYFKKPENEKVDSLKTMTVIEICHPLLHENIQVIVVPDCETAPVNVFSMLDECLPQRLQIFFYCIGDEHLNEKHVRELQKMKEIFGEKVFCFVITSQVRTPENSCCRYTSSPVDKMLEAAAHSIGHSCEDAMENRNLVVFHQLSLIGFHFKEYLESTIPKKSLIDQASAKCEIVDEIQSPEKLYSYIRSCLCSYLIQAASSLNEVHTHCLRQFILSAFDMAREIQITPKRIHYAQKKEEELYRNLMNFACEKQEEIRRLVEVKLHEMKESLIESAVNYKYQAVNLLENQEVRSAQSVHVATSEIHYLILSRINSSVATQIIQSVDCLQDTYVGTLQRCLESLEKNCYEQEGNLLASDAVRQILNAAYNIEVNPSSSSTLLHSFLERLRKLLYSFKFPWALPRRLDADWRKQVATEMIDSLSPSRLVKSIFSNQFKDHLNASHAAFTAALRSLQNHYSGRLERTEEQRVAIRKYHAPKLARLALESTCMCDMIRFGMPQLGKEIGRGQYGVVFSCDSWGGTGPCAVKSVVPPDDKHWNDLAMEFYYTRTIPDHKRIVRLRGSVIDSSYGGGCTPSVLLIMDRLSRDLYYGLRSGLSWVTRLQIAIDVVEGIRYLHSQGLVHRDIKLKNVLLDNDNRAKLTDLGFCIPEAMMSGSIVGTPVHMAPELLSGHYDSSVDVYAFGILFWYICAGHVKLPNVFENFQNKEQLWTSVKRGIRPERLAHFDDQCWHLMEQCWSGEPSRRPLLGYVQPLLESILEQYSRRFSEQLTPE
ncbi:dual serine/threonine and tyrosine protein kinase-like [Schistocerca cancellata]|uniref:dual serine/threonine and tyrosine protein kinase-like n=1 Tax=Schistocerca cancellata TaxID=274614 RepID=UPI00211996CD|nr:dual serine/threonine and tyrosine protein kinase-like [Schistocerca cancellata]